MTKPTHSNDAEALRESVRQGYSEIAQGTAAGCCGPRGSCSGPTPHHNDTLASGLGYSTEELQALPSGANLGLSCGNPAALATLGTGEVVLDLGSGAGFDAFIAGRKVGATGRVIGVDMTAGMLIKARHNLAAYRRDTGLDNVEFRLGEIEHLPVADNSVDVVISNCVINLSPDKRQVWLEIARVLKPGGRAAVSDIALLQSLPEAVRQRIEALVGCVAGAIPADETEQLAREAGLVDLVLRSRTDHLDAMTAWSDPLYRGIVEHLPAGSKPSDYLTSLEVQARKPGKDCCGESCCGGQ